VNAQSSPERARTGPRTAALACALLAAAPAAVVAQQGAPAAPPAPNRVSEFPRTVPSSPASSAARTLTLADALAMARVRQPALRQARADTQVLSARVDQARAPLFPQVEASASYEKTTANFTPRPGATPASLTADRDPTFDLYDYFDFGIAARQLVYDFGQTYHRAESAEAAEQAQQHSERAALAQVEENVRVSFFEARASRAMLGVARETLANNDEHVRQIEGFVRAGTRAEIDLAQARTDRANARVGLINAENAYVAGKARLNHAIGIEGSTDYEVSEESLPPVDGEDGALDLLVRRAVSTRPELAMLERQVRAQELTRTSLRGAHWPSLSLFTGASEAGVELGDMTWNWNAGVVLDWQLFQGGAVSARADEAGAALVSLRAQLDGLRQRVRLQVQEAQLAVRAAKAVITAAEEAITSAREQLRLAEGRYQAGVGSGLELGDAQLAMQSAAAQRVRAEYDLASARARLLRALGR
jgi:outer membrane protein